MAELGVARTTRRRGLDADAIYLTGMPSSGSMKSSPREGSCRPDKNAYAIVSSYN